jgi:predicted unusual protein kinase regulating ubiquinone biosynthesis (AarF/ABC1/UbiB family)
MMTTLFKIPFLRLKYRFLPNEAQAFWAQELLEAQGLGAKLGQVLAQGKKSKAPKSSLTSQEGCELFLKAFGQNMNFGHEVFAASMGQVFYTTMNGHDYAVKILHPGIREKLKLEINNLILLAGHYSKVKKFNFDKSLMRRFLEEVFEQEADLYREGEFQQKFAEIFNSRGKIKVPLVFRNLSNQDILTQQQLPCTLAQDLEQIDNFNIFDFFFDALLNHGLLHGDLNDRNWGINQEGVVVVYDYGCSQIISERRRMGLIKLLQNQDIINGFREFGVRLEATSFKGREQQLRDQLFNPLLKKPIDWNLSYSEQLKEYFGDEIKKLREFSDPWVLLLMRSLFSLIRLYQEKQIPIPLGDILAPYLVIKESSDTVREIKIQVMEAGKTIVFMALPLSALDNLESLMPPRVSEKVQQQGINISQVINQVKDSGFMAQDLFRLHLEERSYHVWIE